MFKLDTSAVEAHAKALAGISRSALPVVVRQTLNSAAFDVKQNTMPAQAKKEFTQRSPNFFKATSGVDMAKGFAISSMKATVGFDDRKAKSGSNPQAVQDLEQQEHGGSIAGRSFLAMDTARVGNNKTKSIRANARLKQLRFTDPKNVRGKNPRQRFVKSVVYAGKGGLVLGEYKGRQIIWRVNSVNRTGDKRFKLTPLYTYQKGRAVKIDKPTHFMRTASLKSANTMQQQFIKHAEKQLAKYHK